MMAMAAYGRVLTDLYPLMVDLFRGWTSVDDWRHAHQCESTIVQCAKQTDKPREARNAVADRRCITAAAQVATMAVRVRCISCAQVQCCVGSGEDQAEVPVRPVARWTIGSPVADVGRGEPSPGIGHA